MPKLLENISCQICDVRLNNIFNCVKENHLPVVARKKTCSLYKKGEIIFNQGDLPAGLYCVNSGKIKVFQTGEEGREQIIRFTKGGDIMGYRALLNNDAFSCSAVALDDCNVCFIPRDTFFALLQSNPQLSLDLLKLLAADLRFAENRITGLAQKPVRERMAEALLFLVETYGYENDNKTLNLAMTREEIANLVGTVSETCIRILTEFKNDGLIETHGKKIIILNFKGLEKIVKFSS